jgi:alkylation response protein AidB-like acyl-CoA dehydrogenase
MTTMRNTVSEPVSFEASDLLNLDRLLSDEERTVREEVNGFVREKIKPYVRDWWEKASFPRKIVPEMGAQGLLGMHLTGYGCTGLLREGHSAQGVQAHLGANRIVSRRLPTPLGRHAPGGQRPARGPFACLNEARYGTIWGAMGAARDCYECALEYSKSRVQFGKPIASFQLTQQKLVNMMLEINKGTMIALHIGRMKDKGEARPEHISFGKLNNVREAIEIAREARTILGGNGVTLEYPVIRHANNLESVRTYEGTDEVHTLILGQAITGIPAFR